MEAIRREFVRRVAAEDRNANRDIYDALEDEYFCSAATGDSTVERTMGAAGARWRVERIHFQVVKWLKSSI